MHKRSYMIDHSKYPGAFKYPLLYGDSDEIGLHALKSN